MRLSKEMLKNGVGLSDDIVFSTTSEKLPEKVLQFGEGNFLRGFVDWMFSRLNREGLFKGQIVVVQPIEQGMVDTLNEQDGLYTLLLRGIENGKLVEKKEIVSCVSRGINIYRDYEAYMKCAENPDLRVIVSNTTEAGIAYDPKDSLQSTLPASFPGKLTAFLYRRFKEFKGDSTKGLIIIPCELIDRNGDNLKRIVVRLSNEWGLEKDFVTWIENSNYFLNTLVDRIVTGYPSNEAEELGNMLGYKDMLLDTAEIFHLWVIEGDKQLEEELPFKKAGLNVIWTEDMTPYRTRKVRILNGAHTMTVLAAYLYGMDTVKECLDNEVIHSFMKKGIFEEIIPTLDLSENELTEYANSVLERFANPFIRHSLLSISLNSTSKFKTRVLPSILEYSNRKGKLPVNLTFSMAALIAFYKGTEIKEGALIGKRGNTEYKICDDMKVLELLSGLWTECDGSRQAILILVTKLLAKTEIWGMDLNSIKGFTSEVTGDLYNIISCGIEKAIKEKV